MQRLRSQAEASPSFVSAETLRHDLARPARQDAGIRPGPSPRNPPPAVRKSPDAIRNLQHLVGNAAVARLVAPSPTGQDSVRQLQRLRVDMTGGGAIGDAPATNHREAVRLALDRLHVLWSIDNATYDSIYPQVSGLAPGTAVTNTSVLATLQAALLFANQPVLPTAVARAQFGTPIADGVGIGQPNHSADVSLVQDLLEEHGLLSVAAAATNERALTTAGGALNASTLPATFTGISRLKIGFVGGAGRREWSPLIRSDEAGPTGEDRLADQTFQYQDFMLFVPSGARATLPNDVHIFFSAGGVVGGGSHTEHHGLRGAAEAGTRILIGVQGQTGQAFTVSDQQIKMALESAGRPASINSITISAHSRGNQGLARTLRERRLTSTLIHHITVLDGNDQSRSLLAAFAAAHIPLSIVTADIVTTGQFGTFPGAVHAAQMDPAAIRAIGYARLINDAVALGRVSPMPPAITALATALGLPPRGSFTTTTPAPSGKVNINAFTRSHTAALAALRAGERAVPNVGALAGTETTAPYAFVEWNDLLNLRDPSAARNTWRSVSPGIYSHHLFVAELAQEFMR